MLVRLTVKNFTHEDLPQLNGWLKERGHELYEMSGLPAVGFIVSDGDLGIATCFLRRCEGGYGIIEGFASNPKAPSHIRHEGLDLAVQIVCVEAEQRGITHIIGWTKSNEVLNRAQDRHGFKMSSMVLITKNLAPEERLDS